MTDALNPDDAYAHRLLDLCRLEREGKISDLREDFDWEVVTATGASLGKVRVWFRYMTPDKGLCWELKPGQTLPAAKVIRKLHPGATVTEVAA